MRRASDLSTLRPFDPSTSRSRPVPDFSTFRPFDSSTSPTTPRPRRRAFTLIELLMVILIISILITLITVAVTSAMKNARIAEVKAEIASLEGALADFRASFGKFPPSQITLYEAGIAWNDPALAPANVRAKALIRSYWPQFDFTLDRDIDQDGTLAEVHTLAGPECLVFFLGGARQPDDPTSPTPLVSTNNAYIGFSKNPADPFNPLGTNRHGPFFEFQVDRLTDLPTPANGFREYLDPLPGQTFPYIYLSSYDGTGYRTLEATAAGLATDFYRQGSAGGPGWKNKSFQIISPGEGGSGAVNAAEAYGNGGVYNPDNTGGLSAGDSDNITNFQGGTLGG